MAASGVADSFDLLGLGPTDLPVPEASSHTAARDGQEVTAYPPAEGPAAGGARPSLLFDPEEPPSSDRGTLARAEAPPDPGQRRFTVRCEGRWRVRSAPSLSSKVIGTVANGTVVIAQEEPGEADRASRAPAPAPPGQQVGHEIASLWVRVLRFEAQEPMGVSEIKRDTASGGELYCLRRNALGYGLYEVGVEALDGPLITLPENLSSELRADAQRAAADKAEDVSLTWKLLGAAESVGRFFTSMSGADEGGVNEDMKPQVRRRPEEVFEVRQREQLKKSAGTLKKAIQKVIAKAGTSQDNLLAGLTKDVCRRFARLRSSVAENARSCPLVVPPQASAATASSGPEGEVVEGSAADLERFVGLLARLERTGGWPELSGELRQEVISFSNKHVVDLDNHAKSVGKAAVAAEGLESSDALGSLGPAQKPAAPAQTASSGIRPLLPPPPPPASGVGTGRLI